MSKLAYFFITLIGAVPGGFLCYLFVMYFKDHGFGGSTIMQVAIWAALVAAFAIVLTPLMVVFWYKAPQGELTAPKPAGSADSDDKPVADKKAAKAAKGQKKEQEADGFEDAIPDNFDEEELEASRASDDFEDGGEENFDYADDELEDFEEEEEEPQPKKKKKK